MQPLEDVRCGTSPQRVQKQTLASYVKERRGNCFWQGGPRRSQRGQPLCHSFYQGDAKRPNVGSRRIIFTGELRCTVGIGLSNTVLFTAQADAVAREL